jgi:hypothetical protein
MFIRAQALLITATWLWKGRSISHEDVASTGIFARKQPNLRAVATAGRKVPSGACALIRIQP